MNHIATPWEPPTGRHNAFSLENVKNLSFIQKNDFFFLFESSLMNLPPVELKGKLIDTHAHTMDCVVLWSLCTYLDKRHLLRDWKTNPCSFTVLHTHCWSGCSLSSCIPPAEGTIWSSTWGVWLATGSFNHCQHPIVRTLIMWCGISCCSVFNTPLYLHLFILSLWLQPRAHSVVWCV